MTAEGTNSFLIGERSLAIIDPGPDSPSHLEALITAVAGRPVEAVLVTHAHVDHSVLAPALAQAVGAPVLAYGDASAGRSDVMTRLAAEGLTTGGEGVDAGFVPDRCLADGEVLQGDGWALEAIWTPGHFGNHLCFALGDVLFTGDLVMGWASSLVSPPDGDLTDFMASCRRLRARDWSRMLPAHGAPIDAPGERLDWLIAHREAREAQVLAALSTPKALDELVAEVYDDLPPAMHPMAARNLFAHLVDLCGRDLLRAEPALSERARFQVV